MANPLEDHPTRLTGTNSGSPMAKNEDSPQRTPILTSAHDQAHVVPPKQSPRINPVSAEENNDQETANDVTEVNACNTPAVVDAGSVDENADPLPDQVLRNDFAAGNAVNTRAVEDDLSGSVIGAVDGAIVDPANNPFGQTVRRKSSGRCDNAVNTHAADEDGPNGSEVGAVGGAIADPANNPSGQIAQRKSSRRHDVVNKRAVEDPLSGSEIGAVGGAIEDPASNPPGRIVQRKSQRRARRTTQSRRKMGRKEKSRNKLKPSTQENANPSRPLESSIVRTGAARLTPAVQKNESFEEVSRDVDAIQAQEATHIRVETHAGSGVVVSPRALSVRSDSLGLLDSTVNHMEPGGSTPQHHEDSEVTAHEVTDVVTERREDHRLYIRGVLALATDAPQRAIHVLLEPRDAHGLPDNIFIDMVNHHPPWSPAVQDLAYPEEIDLHPQDQEQEETAEVCLRPSSTAFSKAF